jgi:metal-sulfur cluster biosynthetic enzyme
VSVDEAEVRAALADVHDPELPVSVVDLGLIRGISIDGSAVTVHMTFTSIACPCTELLKEDVARAVRALEGVSDARVEEVFESWSRADMTDEGRLILRALAVV